MLRYRLSESTQADVVGILAWTHEQFGEAARLRCESLIVTALRDVAAQPNRLGGIARPKLGAGVRPWRLRLSRHHATTPVGVAHRLRHFIVYRIEPDLLVVGRTLRDAMELVQNLDAEAAWE
jgi:toxin ParE1/3/4